MKNKIQLLILLIFVIFISCQEQNSLDEITPSKTNQINLIIDSCIFVDSLTCFQIVLKNANDKIIEAYYNCGKEQARKYNFDKNSLYNCNDKLVLENDTVKIWATYEKNGKINFDNLTLILKDNNNKISYIDTTFSFFVKSRK